MATSYADELREHSQARETMRPLVVLLVATRAKVPKEDEEGDECSSRSSQRDAGDNATIQRAAHFLARVSLLSMTSRSVAAAANY